jgi:hypothetical protein
MASRGALRKIRITILLLMLFTVGMNALLARLRSTDWDQSLWVVIYPVDGDNSAVTQSYIEGLSVDDFQSIESFLGSEAKRYGMEINDPVTVQLAPQVADRPPLPPAKGSTLSVMLWSLGLRYWAYSSDTFEGPRPDVQMFVVYHDPEKHSRLNHSLGIQKGLIGVVNAYAGPAMTQSNNVVITHEFLHTVGASDKYDSASNQPVYPDGYAEPEKSPLHPQSKAEIMAGRIPLSENQAAMPESVATCTVGPETAREIRWIN